MSQKRWVVVVMALVLVAAACSDDSGDSGDDAAEETDETTEDGSGETTTTTVAEDTLPDEEIIFGSEGNRLWAYSNDDPSESQVVIPSAADDPENGLDINAQICFFPDGSGRFIAGEDTGQPNPPAGWGIFQLSGTGVGDLEAEQIGKLTPTYQPGADPENYGCGI